MGQKRGGQANTQLFYSDQATGTVRSKLGDLCIDVMADTLALNPYQPGNGSQEWVLTGNYVTNKRNPALTLDVHGNFRVQGSRLKVGGFQGTQSQQWSLEHAPQQFFQIVSEMNGKALDIQGANRAPGTPVIMWAKPSGNAKPDNQLWYVDSSGIIRSKLNDFALDATSNRIVMNPHNPGNMRQHWQLQGNKIVNRYNTSEVLDIVGADAKDGAQVCPFSYKASPNQHWRIEY
jgi:hypothetical protein